MQTYDYIIIGASAAGISAINSLWRFDPESSVLCITAEKEKPYNKCFLADYAGGSKSAEQVMLRIMHKNVQFLYESRVVKIDSEKKLIKLSDNEYIMGKKFLIATGASPRRPTISGIDADGVFTFHSLSDIETILAYRTRYDQCRVVVLGAGLSGLECADALRSRGCFVTVVERAAQVLPNQLDAQGARMVADAMAHEEIVLKTNCLVEKIETHNKLVSGVELSDGEYIPAGMVVCATGVAPNSDCAKQSGIQTNNNYIQVNDQMQTSHKDIYAAGDVVMVKDIITNQLVPSGTWPDAMHQGRIAAQNMSGVNVSYPGIVAVVSSAFFGLKFASCGVITKQSGNDIISKNEYGYERRFYNESGALCGFVQVGPSINSTPLKREIAQRLHEL